MDQVKGLHGAGEAVQPRLILMDQAANFTSVRPRNTSKASWRTCIRPRESLLQEIGVHYRTQRNPASSPFIWVFDHSSRQVHAGTL